MSGILRLLATERLKLRRSAALRVVWLIPLVFLIFDYRAFGRFLAVSGHLSPLDLAILPYLPLRSLAVLWAGFLHPLTLALLPPLLMRPEHRSNMWKLLHTLPVSRRSLYFAKAITLLVLHAATLLVLALGLRTEWGLIGFLRPQAAFAFPWLLVAKVLGWMYLGSLPVLFFYLWVADRIRASAVPILLGLIGLMLTIALAGREMYPLWQRDLIPWVLPYTCTQRGIEHIQARQEIHLAAEAFQPKQPTLQQPKVDERKLKFKIKIISDLPGDGLKPPPPTPTWLLVVFSLGAGSALLGLGWLDAGRNRE